VAIVLRLVLSPRWMMWHVLTLAAMATCFGLSAWQWQRAGSAYGSALNIGYGLQWPLFAVFFGVMWWRMLRTEIAKLRVPDDVSSLVAAAEEAAVAEETPPPAPASPSPFGPRPRTLELPEDEDEPGGARAEYNRMLAELAARNPDDRP
jgi:DNA-binding transcriptional regulator of glucitol operon